MTEAIASQGMPILTAEQFADNPAALRRELGRMGALDFVPFDSGLFPAMGTPNPNDPTGMGAYAWTRDNAQIIHGLAKAERFDLAAPAAEALMTIFNNERDTLDGVVEGRLSAHSPGSRLPSRVSGHDLGRDPEHRIQNDSIGLPLQSIGKMMLNKALKPTPDDLETLAQTARYVGRIGYWHDRDAGAWEEDARVHASSIGAVVGGLKQTKLVLERYGYPRRHMPPFTEFIQRGQDMLNTMIDFGVTDLHDPLYWPRHAYPVQPPKDDAQSFLRHFSAHNRQRDAAMVFLLGQGVLNESQATKIVADTKTYLMRDHGIIRYVGDTYWSPRFKDLMTINERTSQGPGRLEQRNAKAAGVALSRTEAQWTLHDPLLSDHHGEQYQHNGKLAVHRKQILHLDRMLAQLAPTEDGKLHAPEARYYAFADDQNQWIPNDHSPLLWTQANMLRALITFEETGYQL